MHVAYPYRIDGRGRTAIAAENEHIRQLIEQVLFTSPGERVNRPTFGTGLLQMVFSPNSPEVATATQFIVQSALQRWLGDLVEVEAVQVDPVDERLDVTVRFIVRRTQERQVANFVRGA